MLIVGVICVVGVIGAILFVLRGFVAMYASMISLMLCRRKSKDQFVVAKDVGGEKLVAHSVGLV